MEYPIPGSAPGWWALTGTPGTGKSTVARRLPPGTVSFELRDLAIGLSGVAPGRGPVGVDLPRIGAWMRHHRPPAPVVVAGYLAHRLPTRGIVALRCHPIALAARLRSRRTTARDLRENVQVEALDSIVGEARHRGRPVWEIDTTRAAPDAIARRVERILRDPSEPSDSVDWLSDPHVPPFLLSLPR